VFTDTKKQTNEKYPDAVISQVQRYTACEKNAGFYRCGANALTIVMFDVQGATPFSSAAGPLQF